MNGFCKNVNPDCVVCFSYKKDNAKGNVTGKKQSHQFPNMIIGEVNSNMDSLLPHFNKLVNKILMNMK